MVKRISMAVQHVASASAKYMVVVLLSLLVGLLVVNVQRFSGIQANPLSGVSTVTKLRPPTDFDVFYLVAQMVWRGEIIQAYSFATMGPLQEALSGEKVFMPWTYPPQFNLIVAALAFLPLGTAYTLFTAITLVAYLAMLKAVAGRHFTLLLFLLFPAITVTMVCGQNGFLTGTLIGLTCLGLQRRSALAGLPLGLMIIKPHLAVAFAVYTLLSRSWGAATVAAATILATSALATLLLGPEIWAALLAGVQEAKGYLEQGLYPLYRMVSPYAVLRSFGAPSFAGMVAQLVSAVFSLVVVFLAWRRGFPVRRTLGLAAVASLLVSPYAYDYDLPIYGIGLALLMPDILRLGRPLEQALVFGLSFATGGFGLLLSQLKLTLTTEDMYLSVAGLTLAATLGLLWRIVNRDRPDASLHEPAAFAKQAAR
ncbi:hypothetical protein DC522_06850 [Microvirga sp. KLBC 81]|uniref:glycosyltransferase family 87 protein n=1 Tax=Microvirga sp. KLBC 81 TaxID=1862707 RepID=UPI000D51BF0E|nr:glycosyltransferase family 87 protein [Microvirga sp. KLBC 81]PVE25241.1 hypothetical protein DC522_06850 [Microvirga sp. KLBC 81]